VALCATAGADPEPPVHAGPQPAPPVHASEPVLKQELDARRNVRGCTVGDTCTRPSDVLREFETEALPPPGSSPWLDDRTPPRGRLEAATPRKVRKPSELRPDAPWLDKLELPDLPVTWTPRLVEYLVFYKEDPRGRSIMQSWLAAQGRYRTMIVQHLRDAHLPEDLLYVAMIESGYDPSDSSSAGALGVWQFMPEGGKIYGLREDRWVDERRDPLRSTIAVLDYWKDLYQRFGEWQIALGAFNVGYGAVLRSIARYNTNDYYQLCEFENALPWETCWYTPKVLATAIVGHNRAAFGYDTVKELPPETSEEVAVPMSVSLAVIARAAGTTEAEIKQLNPQLRRGRTPPGEAGYVVRVPVGAKPEFQRKLVELQSDWDGFDAYVVAHGERFEDVATTFGVSSSQLKKLNDVRDEGEIEGGTVLVVPRISDDQRAKNRAKAKASLMSSGVDQKDGEPMIVAVPDKDAKVPGKTRVFYRVVIGDTLHSVAKALGVKQSELARWNAIDEDVKVQPKMVLQAFVAPGIDRDKVTLLDDDGLLVVTRGSAEHLDLQEARLGRVRSEYVATGKEKLADVAKRYGLGSHDLARINRMSYDAVLDKGQKIIVYEVKDPKRSQRADEQWKKTPRARRGKVAKERTERTASAPGDAAGDDADESEKTDKTEKTDKAEPKTDKTEPKTDKTDKAAGPVTRPAQVE
jgi:membrane-bound lytic murein transglycosylase D